MLLLLLLLLLLPLPLPLPLLLLPFSDDQAQTCRGCGPVKHEP